MPHQLLRCKNCPKGGRCSECRRLAKRFDMVKESMLPEKEPCALSPKVRRLFKKTIKRLKVTQ